MWDSFEKLTQEKREYIINVCMDAFIQSGYALANTVEIAKKCGIAKGSLFHYFGNKKSLFLYIARLCMSRVIDETHKALSGISEKDYFNRVRKSVEIKMALPVKFPREIAFLSRAFSERGHEAAEELFSITVDYTAQLRKLNSRYIGEIEPELVRNGINYDDAGIFVQTVFDAVTSRLMQQYSKNPGELLDHPEILANELEKAISFILHGIGK